MCITVRWGREFFNLIKMEIDIIERLELVAIRIPPGDKWTLTGYTKKIVHPSLTDALEAYFQQTGFKGEYRLAPMDSKLYAIKSEEKAKEVELPKVYSFYGEFKQGI